MPDVLHIQPGSHELPLDVLVGLRMSEVTIIGNIIHQMVAQKINNKTEKKKERKQPH